jgi:Cu+-exporting ATPase
VEQHTALKQSTLKISGMTCAACANRIEKGLRRTEGVTDANVNFALEQASVTFDPNLTDHAKMEQKVEQLGYKVVKDHADLQLMGMTCAAYAARIEKGLNRLPGVTKATVNFALESAHVEYNPGEVAVPDMIRKVEQLGYIAANKSSSCEGICKAFLTRF